MAQNHLLAHLCVEGRQNPSSIKMEQENKELLTRKEVTTKLRVSYPTLKRWADSGVIRSIKIGGTVRYKQSDIEKLLTPKSQQNG